MRIKEHSFISALILLPMTIFMGVLLLRGALSGGIYLGIFTGLFVAFWMSFIFASLFATNEIVNSDNRKRIFLFLFVPFIYLPIYYFKYVASDEKKVFGFVPAVLNIILLVGLFLSVKSYTVNYMHEKYIDVNPSFFTYSK